MVTEDHASWLRSAMALLLAWTGCIFCIRAWAKLSARNWGLDDWAVTGSIIAAVIHIAVTYRAIDFGYGRPSHDIPVSNIVYIETGLYIRQCLYVISFGLSKISCALFVSRLSSVAFSTRSVYIIIAISACWTIASVLAVAIRGDYRKPWTTLNGRHEMFIRWIGIESFGLLIEIALWALSMMLVFRVQMRKQRRTFIVTAFSIRLLIIPTVVARLLYLRPGSNPDPFITTIVANIISEIALQLSIISACITCLRPFLRPLHRHYRPDNARKSSFGLLPAGEPKDYFDFEASPSTDSRDLGILPKRSSQPQSPIIFHDVVYPKKAYLGESTPRLTVYQRPQGNGK